MEEVYIAIGPTHKDMQVESVLEVFERGEDAVSFVEDHAKRIEADLNNYFVGTYRVHKASESNDLPQTETGETGEVNRKEGCDRCGGPSSPKTYSNQACIPIDGRVFCIDWCIHQIVAALNAGGVKTLASCCGHGSHPGVISLEDGRDLMIVKREEGHG